MRYLLYLFLVLSLSSFCQEIVSTRDGKQVILNNNGTWKYLKESASAKKSGVIKKFTDDKTGYFLSFDVLVENGKDEKVPVHFDGSVPVTVWDQLIQKDKDGEEDYFSLVANMLSINAKFTLKNTLSFEPFAKQFFMYKDNAFICNYKMSGRNGYGNLVETTALVEYDPSGKIK